ncbi:calcium ion binding protein [Aureococcus anophagefferens]|nr:calcium ion binding protein [Aureococcus anophagefferens]
MQDRAVGYARPDRVDGPPDGHAFALADLRTLALADHCLSITEFSSDWHSDYSRTVDDYRTDGHLRTHTIAIRTGPDGRIDGFFACFAKLLGAGGNYHYFAEVLANGPFDGIRVGAFSAPAFADLDGDGDLDLVVGEWMGALFYYENVGSAASPSYAAVTGSASPFDGIDIGSRSAPAFADVDGDGDLDLVVGISLGSLFYYENVGSAASPSYAAVTGAATPFYGIDVGGHSAPALADVDGDGDLDLVVGKYHGSLFYYENVGSAAGTVYYENVGSAASPRFEARTGSANPFDGIEVDEISKPEFADLDGDGDLDLVVGELMGALYYYERGRAPSSTLPLDYPYDFDYAGAANPFDGIDVERRVRGAPIYAAVTGSPFDGIDVGDFSAPAFADLDGDGDLDLVVGDQNGALYYYENVGSAASPIYAAVTGSPFDGIDVGDYSAPAFADLDGDGDLDLVVGSQDGFLYFFANGHCTQGDAACGSKGLCDQTFVLFTEASCQCLGGYSGDQCGECQTGYFGAACDLCPEGGDEDRDAPRLTDTCGIAGSGRSRGSCDDGVAGSGNCTCYDIFSGSGCTEGTCPAGTIETAAFEGYFNVAECTPCDAGTFSAEGDDQCTNCDAGTYSSPGASECTYSATASSECTVCGIGSYSAAGSDTCTLCPGATGCYSCLEDYYFSPFAVDLDDSGSVPCDNSTALTASCASDSTKCFDQCCLSCERGMDCENATSNTLTAVPIEDGWWRASSYSDEVYQCQYSGACKKGECAEGHEGVACRVCKNDYHHDALKDRCDALPWTLPTVSFPKAFEALIAWTSFLEFNVVQILPIACLRPFNFFDKLLAMTVLPIVFSLLIFLFGELAAMCATAKKAKSIRTTSFGAFLLLTFVVFPSVSTTVLRFYNCVSYEEGFSDGSTETIKVLEADHDISCTSPSYKGIWSTYALAMLFVYTYSRPYIEDADDNLANVGNAQIILVFIASLTLFIKDMDEQDGAPGDIPH